MSNKSEVQVLLESRHAAAEYEVEAVKADIQQVKSLALSKAQKSIRIVTANATDLASAIALLNEIKAKLNEMNS